MNRDRVFSIKYLILAFIFSIVLPLFEKYVMAHADFGKKIKEIASGRLLIIVSAIYGLILYGLNFGRISNYNFWEDEGFSVRLAHMSLMEMIKATANDVHPPLYYIILKFFCMVFGFNQYACHLVSLIPLFLIIAYGFFFVRKNYGLTTYLILITYASLLNCALRYNIEVRMYSLAELLAFMSYMKMNDMLEHNRNKDYCLFLFYSILAAYTHYYALISVAFLYIFMIIYSFVKKRCVMKKILVTSIAAVLLYMPWLIILINSLKRVSGKYWIGSIPSVKDCLYFIFENKYSLWLITAFFLILLNSFLESAGILSIETDGLTVRNLRVNKANMTTDSYNCILWTLAGILAVGGTIATGIWVSEMIRPLFIVRYLLPVAGIAWIMSAISISKLKT